MAQPPPSKVNPVIRMWNYMTEEVDRPMPQLTPAGLMVAASTFAVMNFMAAISPPPRGLDGFPYEYKWFLVADLLALISSSSVIFMVLLGFSLKRRVFSFISRAFMFITVMASLCSCKLVLAATLTDDDQLQIAWCLLSWAVIIWIPAAFLAVVFCLLHY